MNAAHDVSGLHQIDLNLIAALDALLDTASVTLAAERSGISQSAMSHTLRRLRDLLGDPLLVRVGAKMVPSPRAEALRVPLRSALVELARTLAEPNAFDPSTAVREFRIVSPDLFDVLVLPDLLRELGDVGPGINLSVSARYAGLSERLATGDVDLAVLPVLLDGDRAPLSGPVGADLRQKTLFRDTFRCFVRRDHPALGKAKRLSPARYSKLRHIQVAPGGGGTSFVDEILQDHGLSRRIALRVPQFATALAIAVSSDLVLTAPRSLSRCAQAAELISLAPPLAFPEHAVTLVWHPRFAEDPAHRWLRERVAQASSSAP